MCICVGESRMSDTMLYVGDAYRDGKYVHVLAYQNTAESLTGEPNAMILPFPTDEVMDERNILSTSNYKSFLRNISDATKRQRRDRTKGIMTLGCAASDDALVFDVGSYTVVLASHVKQIPEALKRVPEYKRPNVSYRFLLGYGNLYPNQPVAICCWSGTVDAEPLLWWYSPKDKNTFFIPTMDAHDGGAPDLNAMVQTDHIISVGSSLEEIKSGSSVNYTDSLSAEAIQLLPSHVFGTRMKSRVKNGDLYLSIDQLKLDSPMLKRGSSVSETHSNYQMNGWSY
jgi:hypothetical protein